MLKIQNTLAEELTIQYKIQFAFAQSIYNSIFAYLSVQNNFVENASYIFCNLLFN